MPLALTVKSVCGSDAAQSCEGCAAVWITSSRSAADVREDAVDAGDVADVELDRAELARELAQQRVGDARSSTPPARRSCARMSLSMPTTS